MSGKYSHKVTAARLADGVVQTKLAALTFGSVGTFAYLKNPTNGSAIAENTLIAGSSLRYSGVSVDMAGATWYAYLTTGGTPSGTWRSLGTSINGFGTLQPSTLFVRVA